MLKLREVKAFLKSYNIRPSKRLGQNFLIDQNTRKRIIDAARLCREDTVLEIGPGLGALTEEVCKRAKRVIAIEKDRRLYNFLLENVSSSNLELIHGDILRYNFSKVSKIKIIGNLPYYISSPILAYLLKNRSSIDSIFVTLQKEFAERLVAGAGNKTYGAISCFAQFYTKPNFLFVVKKTVFYPVPQVDSSFLEIGIRDGGLYLTDEEKMFKIIKASFEKRRKTILNSLYSGGVFSSREEAIDKLERSGISHTRRPETISLKEFANLANVIKEG